MLANLENSGVATELENVNFYSMPKKGSVKNCSNYQTIALISHTSKVILKILQVRLHHNVTENIHMYKLDLVKAEEQEIKLPTFAES